MVSELIARLMAAIETPDDLTQDDIRWLLEDAHFVLQEAMMSEQTPDKSWPEKDFEEFRDQRKRVMAGNEESELKHIAWKLMWMKRYIYKLEKALNKLSPERVAEVQGWPYNDTTPNPRGIDADSYYEDYQTERYTRRQQAGYDPI